MSEQLDSQPLISRLYVRFVRQGNAAAFIRGVSQSYTLPTLHRVAHDGNCIARRGAVLAITYLGGAESIAAVGQALRDLDRAVRMIAESGVTSVWSRAGSSEQCQRLQAAMRLNRSGQYAQAIELADEILLEHPGFAEAWHQRALAQYSLGELDEAISDSQQALEANPYHFQAAVGLGQCYLERNEPSTAICCFQWALQIHPHLEFARAQVRRLQRELRERLDR